MIIATARVHSLDNTASGLGRFMVQVPVEHLQRVGCRLYDLRVIDQNTAISCYLFKISLNKCNNAYQVLSTECESI